MVIEMRILVVQESDWIKRNPHQQHHLMELLGLRGHKIRVIDYDVEWKNNTEEEDLYKSPRKVSKEYKKVHNTNNVTVIRPPLIRIPVINYFSILYYHIRKTHPFRRSRCAVYQPARPESANQENRRGSRRRVIHQKGAYHDPDPRR